MNPKLYDYLFDVQCRLQNMAFIVKHSNLVVHNLKCNPVYSKEYSDLINKIGQPKASYITFKSGLYLYNLIRTTKPDTVMETGVLHGFSSRIILEALEKNKKGRLISVEIRSSVGQLVTERLKKRWDLVVESESKVLPLALKKSKNIDIFMHDSHHNYTQMKREFNLAIKHMKPNGVILSDDIYVNDAFIEFADSIGKKPKIIGGVAKSFGIIELKG
jgi:hypothetical protein